MGPGATIDCLSDETVLAVRDGGLPMTVRAQLHQHLQSCASCRARVQAAGSGSSSETPRSPLLTEVSRVGPAPTAHELGPGTMVDHYRVERQVGKGGMGEVYLATDSLLGRRVALKMVKPQLMVREKLRQQFFREAQATAKLSHPHIVTIHGVGESEGRLYVALEFVDGETLRERASHTPFVFQETTVIGAEVADALEAAHAAGVIHRDLKPTNVMLGRDGRTRVLDFGLAKMIGADTGSSTGDFSALTHAGDSTQTVLGGTPMYMPPEQWKGTGTGKAADMWALGVILYEMCTGQRPYDRQVDIDDPVERMTTLCTLVCSDEPVPTQHPRIPPALASVISRCLEKNPAFRPTAAEVSQALWAISEAPLARRAGSMTRSQSEVSPVPLSVAPPASSRLPRMVGAAVALVLGGGLAALLTLTRPTPGVPAVAAWSKMAALEPPSPPAEDEAPLEEAIEPAPEPEPSDQTETKSSPSSRPGGTPPAPRDPLSYR